MRNTPSAAAARTTRRRARARGFTLVELLVVIGIIALLISILFPALSKAKESAKKVQCGNNLRTFGHAIAIYVNENKGRVPMHHGGSNWLWDIPYDSRDWLVDTGKIPQSMFYCPSYTHEQEGMWNFAGPPGGRENFMIAGYYWLARRPGYKGAGNTFTPNTMTNMAFRNPREDRWVERVNDRTELSPPARLVMMSDIVISQNDTRSTANNNFITVFGGYHSGHGTTHRIGANPVGGNILCLDGHVEWRSFGDMKNRLVSSPQFWY